MVLNVGIHSFVHDDLKFTFIDKFTRIKSNMDLVFVLLALSEFRSLCYNCFVVVTIS